MKPLAITGERMLPEMKDPIILIEHLHRYALAKQFCVNKEVLDIASGEGYGSHILSGVAARVTGVDIDNESVEYATEKYKKPNLSFLQGSATAIPLEDRTVDVVVSFETLEHHDKHAEMMLEIKRVLKEDGILMISTPDKKFYTDIPNYHNPYHVKELYKDEFYELVGSYFPVVKKIGQHSGLMSVFLPLESASIGYYWSASGDDQSLVVQPDVNPLYLVAIAGQSETRFDSASIFDGNSIQKKITVLTDAARKEAFYQSKDYRIGNFMLRPFRWAKRILNKKV